jgi:hypothetical protein
MTIFEKDNASTTIEDKLQVEVGVLDNVELD